MHRAWLRPLFWIALSVVLGVMGFAMLNACGLTLFGFRLNYCSPAATAPDDLDALLARVRDLERQAALAPDCWQVGAAGLDPAFPVGGPGDAQVADGPSDLPLPDGEPDLGDKPDAPPCPSQPDLPTSAGVVLVLDRSNSMGLPADLSDEEANRLDERINSSNPVVSIAAQVIYDGLIASPGRKRLDELKDAVLQATKPRLPEALLSFAECSEGPTDHGTFGAKDRQEFLQRVMGLEFHGGTPLAKAIKAATARAKSLNDPNARILLISDGGESCGGDPCAAAARTGGIPIDIIAIGEQQPLACIASASGGRILSDASQSSLAETISNAIADAPQTASCD